MASSNSTASRANVCNKLDYLTREDLSSLVECFQVRPGAYPRVEQLKGASLAKALALLENFRLGWKALPRTNNLGYYDHL
jgi:hypothetical protein